MVMCLASLCCGVAQLLRPVMGDVVHREDVLSGCACSLCFHDDQLQACTPLSLLTTMKLSEQLLCRAKGAYRLRLQHKGNATMR